MPIRPGCESPTVQEYRSKSISVITEIEFRRVKRGIDYGREFTVTSSPK